MLGQSRQGSIDPNVAGRGWSVVEEPGGSRHPVAAHSTPVVVEELHQAAIRAAEPTGSSQLDSCAPSCLGSGPEHHAVSLRPRPPANPAERTEVYVIDVHLRMWPCPGTG